MLNYQRVPVKTDSIRSNFSKQHASIALKEHVSLSWYTNTVKIRVQCGKTCMHINTQTYYTTDVVNPMPFQPSPRSACLWVFHGIPTIPKLVMVDIGIGFPTLYCSACGKEPRIRASASSASPAIS